MSEYDFPPTKRAVTYGKKRTLPPAHGILRNGGSATEISAPSIAPTSHSGSPEPAPRSRLASSSSKGKQLGGSSTNRNPRSVRPRAVAEETQSQPLPQSLSVGASLRQDEDARIKKRKLTRTYSERNMDAVDLYAMPDSPPPPRSRSPRRKSPVKVTENAVTATPKPPRVAKPPIRPQATPEKKDVRMKDAPPPQPTPFSVKTSRAWDNLSVDSDAPKKSKQQIPLRLSREPQLPPSSRPAGKKKPSPPLTSMGSRAQVNTGPRKKRLIDALAEQAEESEEEQESQPYQVPPEVLKPPPPKPELPEFVFRDSSPPPPPTPQASRTVVRPAAAAKKTGPKFTYSQQRSMLAEEDALLGGMGLGGIEEEPANGSMFNFGRMPKVSTISKFSFLDEDDETVNTGAVRSLHELRQAGANSRFADEMDDIMDRIGAPSAKPSSLRRGALLELAQKVKEKDFRRQFRNHSGDGNLFKSLGEETDLISGYSILAILVTLLAASSSAHLVQQLRAQGFAVLLSRLLGESSDITVLARDRKQNASRNAQTTLGSIKSSLLSSPIWEPCTPTALPPRTLALKCLDLIMRQPSHTSGEAEILSPAVTDQLFSILSAGASSQACWEFPGQQESTDFYLALYVLEGHSVSAMQSSLGQRWTRQYVPVVVDVLETAMRRPIDKANIDLESLALRITLNVTNNNTEAARMFVDRGLLQELTESACSAFEKVLNSMKVDSFLSEVHESLIMMLGVMINFCVYYPPASQSLEESGDSLDRLIRVFADNHSKTSDADSMEKTQLNVALGYLSILLGYLCLYHSTRERFALVHPKKSIQPLLDSINEFIVFHQKVAEAQGSEGGARPESQFGALVRLQGLVDQLKG